MDSMSPGLYRIFVVRNRCVLKRKEWHDSSPIFLFFIATLRPSWMKN